jgi:hypothetical protein
MAHPALTRPEADEHSSQMANYVQLLPAGDVVTILEAQLDDLSRLVGRLSDEQALVRHAPYTWTIKQVIAHLTDCERVFGYRAMRLARNDATPLPGFDDNAYIRFSDPDRWPISELLSEFELARRSHLLMIRHFESEAWLRRGQVNDHPLTVRAMVCVMAGHTLHHLVILHKRLAG